MEKTYTLNELRHIADTCYVNRWRIGKDAFDSLDAFISVLGMMEQHGKTVEDLLGSIDREDENYPL